VVSYHNPAFTAAHGVRRTFRTLFVFALAIGLLNLVSVEVAAQSFRSSGEDGRRDKVGMISRADDRVQVEKSVRGMDRSSALRGATFEEPLEAVRNFSADGQGWQVDKHPRLMADVNGDGRDDIVGFGDTAVWVSLGRPNGRFEEPLEAVRNFSATGQGWQVDKHPRLMADVNGDGRDDIVGFGHHGVLVSLATS
jgi:hypothetical protein